MKKRAVTFVLTAAIVLCMGSTAFAANWQQDAVGWWWQEDDGSYPVNAWKWIDGNGDGIAECYYFNEGGYCLQNTVTPDLNMVNVDGAWTVDGIVQIRSAWIHVTPEQQPTEQQPPVNEQPPASEQPSQNTGENLDIEGTYKGTVDGNVEYAMIELIDGKYFMEFTWWGKDYIPYVGGGVFEDKQIRVTFNGDVLTFSYVHGGESYQLRKQ